MNLLRKILFPFAILYGIITGMRNFLYDKGILKSYSFDIPIIAVGNLSLGGTGKTPQIEYLIRLLSSKYNVATLSRGYKRKSKGFILADSTSNAEILGDEPFQFFSKFPNIQVAVDANRKKGIVQLLSQNQKPEIILLDDAFQHRRVKAGFYILLTTYEDLFVDDYLFPAGNLRESKVGVNRATIVIVTKCLPTLSLEEQKIITNKLNLLPNQALYFSFIDFDDSVYSADEILKVNEIKSTSKLLLAGIAKPETFFSYLENENDFLMTFPDHHYFTEKDITSISYQATDKIIVTTEKDYVRLNGELSNCKLFYLPIKSNFISGKDKFDEAIMNYLALSRFNR
jgi:tetraacyldisaccharide 4'-kinase